MIDKIDWSKLPKSPYGDDVLFRMFIPDEMSQLRRLHAAICKWRDLSFNELRDAAPQEPREPTAAELYDCCHYDPNTEEAILLHGTERVMCANLAVTIGACFENFAKKICEARNVDCPGDFGIVCQRLGNSLSTDIAQLPGYQANQRARMLGNCFKHKRGRTDKRFVEKFGGKLDEVIEYEREDWPAMIDGTETALIELTSRLR